jgi:hypothetical protein
MGEVAVSFTAARDLDDGGRAVILNVLAGVPFADRYVTGGAIGGDAFTGRWLALNRPDAWHTVIVPADKSRVDPWWLTVPSSVLLEVVPMPPGSTYADRNAEIVKQGTMLFGFPAYPEDDPRSVRSGSWQTIRMARRAAKLSQWACVKPPYRGRIEKWPSEFLPSGEPAITEGELAP